jgi:hypothetical protein
MGGKPETTKEKVIVFAVFAIGLVAGFNQLVPDGPGILWLLES